MRVSCTLLIYTIAFSPCTGRVYAPAEGRVFSDAEFEHSTGHPREVASGSSTARLYIYMIRVAIALHTSRLLPQTFSGRIARDNDGGAGCVIHHRRDLIVPLFHGEAV